MHQLCALKHHNGKHKHIYPLKPPFSGSDAFCSRGCLHCVACRVRVYSASSPPIRQQSRTCGVLLLSSIQGKKRHVWLKRINLQGNKVQTRVTYALTLNCMQSENRVWAMCLRWPACYWRVCACAQVCPLRVHPCPLPMTMSVCRCTLVSTHTSPLLLGIL